MGFKNIDLMIVELQKQAFSNPELQLQVNCLNVHNPDLVVKLFNEYCMPSKFDSKSDPRPSKHKTKKY